MTDIFSPVTLGDIALANRIVMAPMTRDRAGPGDVPTDIMVDYYRQRAGAGLIVTEGTQPSPTGKGYWRTPGIHSAAQVAGWRKVADAVHEQGGKIVMQIMHVGRAAVQANKDADAETIAPSAIQCPDKIPGPDGVPVETVMPRALEIDEIPGVIAEYVAAASNAIAAGMDGIELHCASGYLPMQFLSSNSNLRTDRYGGTVENRIRFVVELLEALAAAIGAGRVGFRICPGVKFNGMDDANPHETYAALLRAVDGLGLAYCHLIHIPLEGQDALDLVRTNWNGAIIENGGLTLDKASAIIADGKADAVSFGYLYISNPDLVERFRLGAPLVKASRANLYTGEGDDRKGYTDYAALGA
ncbi:12-oxophytodienoate reductase [Sphingobium herbicidovorans NBRC 16415]|uniref:12-oxophytodienoate reductase n=1 Tax=Sphingobium herbicidovorans (strain ATCC 700291 / DSM 11019 / CCUG 56400 / KCTC 2939 / LMG 18315 / NBRC 16415 / MH) TaxID=1219045 RepID=A0A086PC46_SPHHM|nr:alkene reductase [Sphingobium herbicidovorans]KFG90964.1 12-oxophytodienoate reductase [Sphingobium herbicidovorans NBRC 16415]